MLLPEQLGKRSPSELARGTALVQPEGPLEMPEPFVPHIPCQLRDPDVRVLPYQRTGLPDPKRSLIGQRRRINVL